MAFAISETINSEKDNVAELIYLLNSFFNSLCTTALAIAIVRITISKNQKSVDDAFAWAKRATIVFIIFNLCGTFINWVDFQNFGSGADYLDGSYNDLSDAIDSFASNTP